MSLPIGILIMPRPPLAGIVARCREYETMGFQSVWVCDHFADQQFEPLFESWTLLSALAATTSRVRLGVAATCLPYRQPAVLAKSAATVDHIAGSAWIWGWAPAGGNRSSSDSATSFHYRRSGPDGSRRPSPPCKRFSSGSAPNRSSSRTRRSCWRHKGRGCWKRWRATVTPVSPRSASRRPRSAQGTGNSMSGPRRTGGRRRRYGGFISGRRGSRKTIRGTRSLPSRASPTRIDPRAYPSSSSKSRDRIKPAFFIKLHDMPPTLGDNLNIVMVTRLLAARIMHPRPGLRDAR